MPIRRKLTLVIMLTACTALLVTSIAAATFGITRHRRSIVRDLAALADVIERHCSDPHFWGDPEAARITLATLDTNTDIVSACIYSGDGKVFARYAQEGVEGIVVPPAPEADGVRFEGGRLLLFRRLSRSGDFVGTLYLQSDLREQQARLLGYGLIAGVAVILSAFVALLLSGWLQRIFSAPILDLARVAGGVTENQDYSVRASKRGRDEIGSLVDAFNTMLGRVQEHDAALRAANEKLEASHEQLQVELSERKRAAAALQSSEEQFRLLVENVRGAFWMTDAAMSQSVYVSPVYERIWGVNGSNSSTVPFLRSVHPGDAESVRQSCEQLRQAGTCEVDYRIVRPDGGVRWIRNRGFAVRDESGGVARFAGIALDVTERKRTEEAVRFQSEVIANMEEGVAVVRSSDSMIVYANPKLERMFGYGPGELTGKPVAVLNAPNGDGAGEADADMTSSLRTTGQWSGEVCSQTKSGAPFWCYANVSTFEHGDYGTVWVSVRSDITERKQARETLLQSEERYRDLVQTARDVIFTLSAEGMLESLNPAFEDVTGWRTADWICKPFPPLVHPDDLGRAMQLFQRSLRGESVPVFELRILHKRGDYVMAEFATTPQRRDGKVVGILGVGRDITERRRAEEALRDAEEKWLSLVQNAREFIYIVDKDGVMLSFNRAADGLNPSDVVGRTVYEHTHAEDHAGMRQTLRQAFEDGKAGQFEVRGPGAHGAVAWYETRVVPVKHDGSVVSAMLISSDITERKRAEEEIGKLQERLRSMFESSSDAIALTDVDGTLREVNAAFEKLTGYSRVELVSARKYQDLTPAEYHSMEQEFVEEMMLAHRPAEYEKEYVRKDGSRVPIRLTAFMMKSADGEVSGLGAFIKDITERKRAEGALREAGQRLRAILDNTTAVIYLKDVQGRYILVNRRFEQLFGVTESQVKGKTDHDVFPRNTADAFRAHDVKVAEANAPIEFEEVVPQEDGTHTYISIKFPLHDADGRVYGVCGISTDITERKRLEREILEISEREQRRIGQDLHDGLCQHLVGTALAAQTLAEKLSGKSPRHAFAAGEIADLIGDAIGLARGMARGLYPVQVDEAGLMSALRELAAGTEEVCRVKCRFACDVPVLISDNTMSVHLYRVAQEAVSNAIKHAQAKRIDISLEQTGATVTLTVRDDGVGLPKNAQSSGGIGMHIMAYRAQVIGGAFRARNHPDGGTVITCSCNNRRQQ